MKILLIDVCGSFLDFGMRCQNHGHQVKLFIRKTREGLTNHIGEGIVPRVSSFEDHMSWADLILVSDNTFYLTILDRYRDKGMKIVGPSEQAAELELDRDLGQRTFEKAGIEIIPSKPFRNYDEALAHVMASPEKRFVSKPTGDGSGEASKAMSYVSKDAADMVYMLQKWKKTNPRSEFILQEFVPGIEMAVGGWFGPNGFSKYFLENFEHKKLMNGDLGVNTGEQGTALKYVTDSKLADICLRPLELVLHTLDYTGFIDVSVIIDAKGVPRPLEFTCRPGWPLFQIQQIVHKGDPVQWMYDMFEGKDTFKPSKDIAIGVVLSIPDYPYTRLTKKEVSGIPIYGYNEENKFFNNLHPCEMMMGKAPCLVDGKVVTTEMYVSAGDYLMVSTGTGKTVKEAKERSYKALKSISVPNSPMYRTDIGDRLEEELPKLHAMGFALEWTYD
jgi:phosphoribosylamine--glycine ligase